MHCRRIDGNAVGIAAGFAAGIHGRNSRPFICFIAMSSENPHSIGPSGVAETGPDYKWKKRRR
jgi:hypothetical protein